MPTRNVVLTSHQADMIERLVASGRYQNASEVLREGLRLIEARDLEEQARLAALRDAVHVGVADIEDGRYRSFSSTKALEHHLASIAQDTISDRGSGKRRK